MFSGTQPYYIDRMEILSNVNQEQLFYHYTGVEVILHKKYLSLFRSDRNPGCRFEWHSGILYFIENTRFMNRLYWDIFHCISYLNNVTYQQAIHIVARDYNINSGSYIPEKYIVKERPIIRFTHKPFPEDNLFFLSNDLLHKEGIFLVEDYWIGKGMDLKKNSIYNPRKELCIAYYFPDSDHTKLYFPEKIKDKWYSNCDINDVFGKYKLEYYKTQGKNIIITKSQKDRIILDYHLGFNAIAVQNEGSKLSDEVKQYLIENFENIYILFDNDIPGIDAAINMQQSIPNSKIISLECSYKDPYEIYCNIDKKLKTFINHGIR